MGCPSTYFLVPLLEPLLPLELPLLGGLFPLCPPLGFPVVEGILPPSP